ISQGIQVIALADNPHPGFAVYQCVEDNPEDFSQCDFETKEGVGTSALREAAKNVQGASIIDLTDRICVEERCPAVIGGVLVYRQGSHITATYARTLAPDVEASLMPLMNDPPSKR
ncbi:MAG: SGNH hydrolase domain-containing protein, partial [Ornithinimicrobium sp.]